MAGESGTKRKRSARDGRPSRSPSPSRADVISRRRRVQESAVQSARETKHTDEPPKPHRDDQYYRELYRQELDFGRMARKDPDFAAVLKPNNQLDFSEPATVMQLTKSSLKLDFGLRLELPDDRLCPPVPNRHNYILWLKDLLDSSSYDEPGGKLVGLDIGTGSSCIYPLLGCIQRPWEFIATEVDEKNIQYAAKNIALNNLKDRITLVRRPNPEKAPLIPLEELDITAIDFVMNNPPFYSSAAELKKLASQKALPPSSACTGAPVEMVHRAGGEIGFVSRILKESAALKDRVRWFTAMLGKVSSLEVLVDLLRDEGIDNYAVTQFVQGTKTKRWALGWSYGSMRPSQAAARGMSQLAWKKILPPAVEGVIGQFDKRDVEVVADRLQAVLAELELESWEWKTARSRALVRTRENVWGRAWRRKKAREEAEAINGGTTTSEHAAGMTEKPMSGFEIVIALGSDDLGTVSCIWREGHDEAMFESFRGFLKTKLGLLGGTAKH